MRWKQLQYTINGKMVAFMRKHGKHANTLLLGRTEWAIFTSVNEDSDIIDGDHIWGMVVGVNDSEDTFIEVSRDENIVKDIADNTREYIFRVSICVPEGFIKCFQSFINIQIKDSNGVRVAVWNNDRMFNIRIGGKDKDNVNTFGENIFSLWAVYVYIINDIFKGDVAWFEEMRNTKEN